MSEVQSIQENHLITGDVPLQRVILPRYLRSIVSLVIILLSPVFLLSNYRPLGHNCTAFQRLVEGSPIEALWNSTPKPKEWLTPLGPVTLSGRAGCQL